MVDEAEDGELAVHMATEGEYDAIVMDRMMPGLSGLELIKQIRADGDLAPTPVLAVTNLATPADKRRLAEAGFDGHVSKPIKPKEVLARMAVHLQGARLARQTRNALDAFGYASITVRPGDGRLMWQTPLARDLLKAYFGTSAPETPAPILAWLRRHLGEAERSIEPPRLTAELGTRRLSIRLHRQTGDDDWLIVMREVSDAAIIASMALAFGLTPREAEVLYWVVKGKINRDIADIVGASPATVKKHLERIFAKLGVETRTAAAAMAMNRIRQLHPQFEG